METGTVYGYARVSARDQREDRQIAALRAFGVEQRRIVLDKQSGKDFMRPGYQKLLRRLKPGDTLAVHSIDRLGRNYDEILEQWRILTRERNVALVVLDMPLLDTRSGRDLTGVLIADIALQLLSYVAQVERENIRARQAQGIAAARARGVRLGRMPIARPQGFIGVYCRWRQGQLGSRAAAAELGVSQNTFLKWAREEGKIQQEDKEAPVNKALGLP